MNKKWKARGSAGRRRDFALRARRKPARKVAINTRAKRASAPPHKTTSFTFPQLMNKKGMEMWQLVFLILALLLFFFALAWYGGLNTQLGEIFAKWNEVF